MLYSFNDFPGFDEADFDAFAPNKWSSNRFNLERMKTRAKLDSLGRALERPLADHIGELVFASTLDHPHIFNQNQVGHMWLYLDRLTEERDQLARVIDKDISLQQKVNETVPQRHVALVGVGIEEDHASLFFRLHSGARLDRRNLLTRLADPAEVQHLAVLFSRLGDGFQLALNNDLTPLPATAESLADLVNTLETLDGCFSIEQRFDRTDDALASQGFVDVAAKALPGLLDIWHFAAWSRDNDRLKLAKTLKEEKKQKAKRLSGFEQGDRVKVTSGLLAGKEGSVVSVDLKGRVKVQFGRLNMEMEAKLLKRI